ncbi:MAG: hypothetical protein P0S96_08170 [Simkaniaceae bacterium]|nr:hypothetical protein [Candidatus Sacchlamyda saccharinae]
MRITPASHQGVSSVSSSKSRDVAPKQIYGSSIQSMRYPGTRLGRAINQLVESFAMMMLLPFFIYTFFIASVSLLFLPVLVVFVPFIIIGDLFREILHTVLPWIFPDPRFR